MWYRSWGQVKGIAKNPKNIMNAHSCPSQPQRREGGGAVARLRLARPLPPFNYRRPRMATLEHPRRSPIRRVRLLALASLALASCGLEPVTEESPEIRAELERRDSIRAAVGARYEAALARRDSVLALRAAFSDSVLQRLGLGTLDSLLFRAELVEELERRRAERSGAPGDSIRTEFERRFSPGALAAIEAYRAWERIDWDGAASPYARFQLFTECAPVKLAARGSVELADGVREMAESRLRAAGIWGGLETEEYSVPLMLAFSTFGGALTFSKEVWDPLSGEFLEDEVWESSQPAADELQSASILVDRFILAYLRVNEGYC